MNAKTEGNGVATVKPDEGLDLCAGVSSYGRIEQVDVPEPVEGDSQVTEINSGVARVSGRTQRSR
jgi:hypothetical protein